jgi:hypothetical protein
MVYLTMCDGAIAITDGVKHSGIPCKIFWLVCLVAGAKKGSKGSIILKGVWSFPLFEELPPFGFYPPLPKQLTYFGKGADTSTLLAVGFCGAATVIPVQVQQILIVLLSLIPLLQQTNKQTNNAMILLRIVTFRSFLPLLLLAALVATSTQASSFDPYKWNGGLSVLWPARTLAFWLPTLI